MKRISLLIGVVVLLFFGCDKYSAEQDVADKIKEVGILQALASNKSIAKDNSIDSTLYYVYKAQEIIDSNINLPDSLLIENIFRKGYYYKQIGVKDSAAIYFHKAIDLVKKPNDRKRNYVYFRNTWESDERNKRFANGISVAQKFIEISDSEKYNKQLVYAYNYLERAYINLQNYKKALHYNSKALEKAKLAANMNMYLITATSKVYTLYYDLNKKKEAFTLLDSLNLVQCTKDIKGEKAKLQLYRAHGVLNYYEGNYNEAVKYYSRVLKTSKALAKKSTKAKSNYALLEAYNNITDAYLQLKENKIAEQYLDSTKAIINANSNPDYVRSYNEYRFVLNYRTKAEEEEVLKSYRKLIDENNKLHENKIDEKLFALEAANEKEKIALAEKNEAKLRVVKLIALSGFLGLLMLIGYLLFRQRRHKFEKQDLQMQQRLLRSQMNPHFTFNTLSAIQNQIEENKEGAVNYLLKFSRLLRLILENSLNNYVQIENELESLRKYIDLQLLRFPNKFNYNIILEGFEEEDFLFIPPMLMQPFVENSIEHGFLGIDYKGQINIKLKLEDKYLNCTIEDNGVGIKKSNNNYKKSVSTKLISKFINKTTKSNVVIVDKKNEAINSSGVLVKLLIPYKFSEND